MIYLALSGSGPQHDEPASAHRWTTREAAQWSRSSRGGQVARLANGGLQLVMEFNLVAADRGERRIWSWRCKLSRVGVTVESATAARKLFGIP